MMQKTTGVALAIDDYCAIEFVDGQYQVITSRLHAHAYKVYWKRKKFYHEVLDASSNFNVEDLLYMSNS